MKKINSIFLFVFLLLGLLNRFESTLILGKLLLIIAISFLFYQIYFFKKNQIFIMFSVYALTYYLYLLPYYFSDIYYAIQYNLITLKNTNELIFMQSLFTCLFFLFLKIPKHKMLKGKIKSIKEDQRIYYICTIIMCYICFIKLRGENIFIVAYGKNQINSPILEYYTIFFILAWKYIKNKKLEGFLFFISIIYIIKLLLFGLRLAALFQIMLIFILFFENRIKTYKLICGIIVGFIFFSFLSFFRTGILTTDITSLLGIATNGNARWLQTNQGDVWMSSSMYLDLYKSGIFDLETKFKSIVGFWMSIFIPSKYVYLESYFRNYAQQFYTEKVGGGGITAIYLYIWYGYTGIISFAYFIASKINKTYEKKGEVYGLFLMVIFIRWYSYNILIVFKMGFYLFIVEKLLVIVSKSLNELKEVRKK